MDIQSFNKLLVSDTYILLGQSKIIIMLQKYTHIAIFNAIFFSTNEKFISTIVIYLQYLYVMAKKLLVCQS